MVRVNLRTCDRCGSSDEIWACNRCDMLVCCDHAVFYDDKGVDIIGCLECKDYIVATFAGWRWVDLPNRGRWVR